MEFVKRESSLAAGTVAYHVAGDGDPVLCLHGGGGFRPTGALAALAGQFRVYAPVIPGFDGTQPLDGIASMPALAALLGDFADQVIQRRCHLLGHSFGGWLAAWIAVLTPGKIDRLVLEAPSGFRKGPPRPVPDTLEALHRALIAHPEKAPAESKSPETLARNRDMLGHYYREPAEPGAGRVLFGDNDTALGDRLAEIQAPTLILHGAKDGAVPADSARFIAQSIPRADLVYIDDAAHAIEIDQPEIVAALVIDFLTG